MLGLLTNGQVTQRENSSSNESKNPALVSPAVPVQGKAPGRDTDLNKPLYFLGWQHPERLGSSFPAPQCGLPR